jgi:Ca-activated chloride channel family protein
LKRVLIPALLLCAFSRAQQTSDNHSDAEFITVACAVSDRSGAPVRNLTVADFAVTDNGQPREIRSAAPASDLPLTLALVADVSGTQEDFIAAHRDDIGQFLKRVIGPADRAIVVQTGRQAWLLSDATGPSAIDAAVAKTGVHQTKQTNLVGPVCRNARVPHSCGESALWHGLYYTATRLKPVAGRKAMVVLSDGIDTGSDRSEEDVIEAAQSAGIVLYSLKYSSPANLGSIRKVVAETVGKSLEHLDRETGGLTFPNPAKKLAEDFSRIESDLHDMYILAFAPPPDARDGRFHKLEVKTSRGNLMVRARAGYWASTGN